MSQRRAKQERRRMRAQQPPIRPAAPAQMMPQRFRVLHYRGDVTSSANAQPGQILGHDEFGRPYEVIDAEVGYYCPHGTDHPRCQVRTTVNVQYATPENIRAAMVLMGLAA